MRTPRRTATVGAFWETTAGANDSNQWTPALEEINNLRIKLRSLLVRYFGGEYGDPLRDEPGRDTDLGEFVKALFDDPVGDRRGRRFRSGEIIPMPTEPSDGGDLFGASMPVIGVDDDALVAKFLRMAGQYGELQLKLTGPQEVMVQALAKRIENHRSGRKGVNVAVISKLTVDFVEVLRLSIPPVRQPPGLWTAMLSLLVQFRDSLAAIVEGLEDDRYGKQRAVLELELQQVDQPLDFDRNLARRVDEFRRAQLYNNQLLTISRARAKPVELGGSGDCFFYSLAYVLADPMLMPNPNYVDPCNGTRAPNTPSIEVIPRDIITNGTAHEKHVLADELRRVLCQYMHRQLQGQAHRDMREWAVSQMANTFRQDMREIDFKDLDTFARVPGIPRRFPGTRGDPSEYLLEAVRIGHTTPDGLFMPDETVEASEARIDALYLRYKKMMRRSFLLNNVDVVYADDLMVKVAAEHFNLHITVYQYPTRGSDYVKGVAHGSLSSNRWVTMLLCAWDYKKGLPFPLDAINSMGELKVPDHYVPLCEQTPVADPIAANWDPSMVPDKWTPGPEITDPVVGVSEQEMEVKGQEALEQAAVARAGASERAVAAKRADRQREAEMGQARAAERAKLNAEAEEAAKRQGIATAEANADAARRRAAEEIEQKLEANKKSMAQGAWLEKERAGLDAARHQRQMQREREEERSRREAEASAPRSTSEYIRARRAAKAAGPPPPPRPP